MKQNKTLNDCTTKSHGGSLRGSDVPPEDLPEDVQDETQGAAFCRAARGAESPGRASAKGFCHGFSHCAGLRDLLLCSGDTDLVYPFCHMKQEGKC